MMVGGKREQAFKLFGSCYRLERVQSQLIRVNLKTEFSHGKTDKIMISSTLESVFEKLCFGDRKRRFSVDVRSKRRKINAFSNLSGLIWAEPYIR